MATNGYEISATLASKYAPLIKRSRDLYDHIPRYQFAALREAGALNIDLWVNGSIYLHNPLNAERHPCF
jgi:hypothetical protein